MLDIYTKKYFQIQLYKLEKLPSLDRLLLVPSPVESLLPLPLLGECRCWLLMYCWSFMLLRYCCKLMKGLMLLLVAAPSICCWLLRCSCCCWSCRSCFLFIFKIKVFFKALYFSIFFNQFCVFFLILKSIKTLFCKEKKIRNWLTYKVSAAHMHEKIFQTEIMTRYKTRCYNIVYTTNCQPDTTVLGCSRHKYSV